MSDYLPNFRQLRRSRPQLKPGDIFAMLLPDEQYLFGRVILVDLPLECAPMPDANLIYIYRERSAEKVIESEKLNIEKLLLPPIYTNRLGWTRGYFENVAFEPLADRMMLRQHCFLRFNGDYLDERGRKLVTPSEPCGDWELKSFAAIDDLVSEALSIPRAPGGR